MGTQQLRRAAVLVLLAVSLAASVRINTSAEPAPPVSPTQINEWVRQLASPDFRVREAASAELRKHPQARSAVREASLSSDPEVAGRAAAIFRELAKLEDLRALPLIRAHILDHEPDLFVERVRRYGGDEVVVWQSITDFGVLTFESQVNRFRGKQKILAWAGLPGKDFAEAERRARRRVLPPNADSVMDEGSYLFRGESLTLGSRPRLHLAAMGGPLNASELFGYIFVNSDLRMVENPPRTPEKPRRRILSGVSVCDGDVSFPPPVERHERDEISGAVVVSNGTVRCPKTIAGCTILAAGDVHIPEGASVQYATIRAGGKVHLPEQWDEKDSDIREAVPEPLKPFKFFDLSRVGVEVVAVKGVQVRKVEDKKPFAAAGLIKGDVITAVDGKPVESPAGFRKQVRAAFVEGQATLTVKRGGDTREVMVRFPD